MDNILELHRDLASNTYRHGNYFAFKVNDTKPRDIHKASVRDRLLHHALYRTLYPFFDRQFIFDSYSCRLGKGTHRAMNRFREFSRVVSKNHTRTCWVLKCDIKKFFEHIDHEILIAMLRKHIADEHILRLLGNVIESFSPGLPLGNLTSQLLVNIYMNKFDQFAKRELNAKYYIRYADDFVLMSEDRRVLKSILPKIAEFLETKLKLSLHPHKVKIATIASGIDFLGWTHFPQHRTLRTSTKWRMIRNLEKNFSTEIRASYLGLLSHGNAYGLQKRMQLDILKE